MNGENLANLKDRTLLLCESICSFSLSGILVCYHRQSFGIVQPSQTLQLDTKNWLFVEQERYSFQGIPAFDNHPRFHCKKGKMYEIVETLFALVQSD